MGRCSFHSGDSGEARSGPAPLVFIGYGIRSPDQGHDDFAGVDLKGKVAVVLASAAPRGIPGPALAAGRAAGAEALRTGGAVGVLTIASPHSDLPWDRYALSRLHPQMRLASDSTGHDGGSSITVVLNSARAERLFSGAGRSYTSIQSLADSGAPLPSFDLPVRLRATVAVDESEAVSDNVAGLLPGADRQLKMEYLALTAHLDHLGVGQPVAGDSIFNGAMDNASGIATLIETATALGAHRPRPRRSVLFVAVTGEEKRLLGSDHFAGHPTIPESGALVANLNTDMFLPINPLRRLLVNGLEESDLAPTGRRGRRGIRRARSGRRDPRRTEWASGECHLTCPRSPRAQVGLLPATPSRARRPYRGLCPGFPGATATRTSLPTTRPTFSAVGLRTSPAGRHRGAHAGRRWLNASRVEGGSYS